MSKKIMIPFNRDNISSCRHILQNPNAAVSPVDHIPEDVQRIRFTEMNFLQHVSVFVITAMQIADGIDHGLSSSVLQKHFVFDKFFAD